MWSSGYYHVVGFSRVILKLFHRFVEVLECLFYS